MSRIILVALVLCGCSAQMPGYNMFANWCLDHTCDYADGTFTPDLGHEAEVAVAAGNLNSQTDLDLVVLPGGIPVHFVAAVFDQDGESVCGITLVGKLDDEVMSIDISIATEHLDGCLPAWAIVRHEIACHALHPLATHTLTGMCSPTSMGELTIDDVSMEAITQGW